MSCKLRNFTITDVAPPASAASTQGACPAKAQVSDSSSENAMPCVFRCRPPRRSRSPFRGPAADASTEKTMPIGLSAGVDA